jgi:ferredoxin
METGIWVRDFKAIDKDNAIIGDYDSTPRQRVSHDQSKLKSFRDSRKVLTEEEVKKEAGRCLKCGVSEVNQNKCIGCGLCTTKCKFDAISISKVYDNDFGVMNEECFGALEPNFKLILKGDHEIIRESVEK